MLNLKKLLAKILNEIFLLKTGKMNQGSIQYSSNNGLTVLENDGNTRYLFSTFSQNNQGLVTGPTSQAQVSTNYVLTGNHAWTSAKLTDTTYALFSSALNGIVQKPSSSAIASTNYVLTGDNSWRSVGSIDTTYALFSSASNGIVQKPSSSAIASTNYVLTGDNSWRSVGSIDTTYAVYSSSNSSGGLVANNFSTDVASTASYLLSRSGKWLSLPSESFSNTTYSIFSPANGTTSGTSGLVPIPTSATTTRYEGTTGTSKYWLNATGEWKTLPAASSLQAGIQAVSNFNFTQFLKNGYRIGSNNSATSLVAEGAWQTLCSISIPTNTTTATRSYLLIGTCNFPAPSANEWKSLRIRNVQGGNQDASILPSGMSGLKTIVRYLVMNPNDEGFTASLQARSKSACSVTDQYLIAIPFRGENG